MKRVEVVVEREEMNSTKFDGVKEWGRAGCLGKGKGEGGISVSVSMSSGGDRQKSNERTDLIESASETPRTGRH
jgi:hypothetical protein